MRPLLLALLFASAASAQPSYSVSGAVGVPQGGFRDALGAVGGGLSVGAYYYVPRTPLAFGVEGAALVYGHERRREPFSRTIPDVTVDVVTSNNLAQGLAVVRLQVPGGPVRPYVDGVAGLSYLFTQTEVQSPHERPVASSVTYDDVAAVYGAGAGAQVRLHQGWDGRGRYYEVLLDTRVRYLVGGEASYLGAGDVDRFGDGTYEVWPRRSRTDLVTPHVGVTVRF